MAAISGILCIVHLLMFANALNVYDWEDTQEWMIHVLLAIAACVCSILSTLIILKEPFDNHIDLDKLDDYLSGKMSDEQFDQFLDDNIDHMAICHECLSFIGHMWQVKPVILSTDDASRMANKSDR